MALQQTGLRAIIAVAPERIDVPGEEFIPDYKEVEELEEHGSSHSGVTPPCSSPKAPQVLLQTDSPEH